MGWNAGKILQAVADLRSDPVGAEPLGESSRGLDSHSIAEQTGLKPEAVTMSCAVLVGLGMLTRIRPGVFAITETGRLALDGGMPLKSGPRGASPRCRTGGLRQMAWAAIRIEKKFSLHSLMGLVCDGNEKDAYGNLKRYVNALEKAAYLTRLRRGKGESPHSNGNVRWLLVRDTGRLAPVWRVRSRTVFDPNTREEIALNPLPNPSPASGRGAKEA